MSVKGMLAVGSSGAGSPELGGTVAAGSIFDGSLQMSVEIVRISMAELDCPLRGCGGPKRSQRLKRAVVATRVPAISIP